jgi:hypothetical protein
MRRSLLGVIVALMLALSTGSAVARSNADRYVCERTGDAVAAAFKLRPERVKAILASIARRQHDVQRAGLRRAVRTAVASRSKISSPTDGIIGPAGDALNQLDDKCITLGLI